MDMSVYRWSNYQVKSRTSAKLESWSKQKYLENVWCWRNTWGRDKMEGRVWVLFYGGAFVSACSNSRGYLCLNNRQSDF